MANTTDLQYLWPPNFSGSMSVKGVRRVKMRYTCIYSDTAISDVVMIDKSTLLGPDGTEPTSLVIEKIEWSLKGFTYAMLEWDDDTADGPIVVMPGDSDNYVDFTCTGGLLDDTSGGTGDIVLTAAGADAGDVLMVTITARLKD